MKDTPIINIVATRCHPDDGEKFNKWYNEAHIPLLLKLKGLTEVTRYKITTETGEYPKYLAIYQYESQKAFEESQNSPEFAAVIDEIKETWKEKAPEMIWKVQYEYIRSWKK